MITKKTIIRKEGANKANGTNRTNRTNRPNGAFGWLLLLLLFSLGAQGQIKIGGNVYGGGNSAEVGGNTTVIVRAGDIGMRDPESDVPLSNPRGRVFGGARMANVGGSTLVHIDGAHASGDMVINQVYGGNDISGIVGSDPEATKRTLAEIEEVMPDAASDEVDNTWNSYVHLSTKTEEVAGKIQEAASAKKVYIGQLFAGGNGNYDYPAPTIVGSKTVHEVYNLPRTVGDVPVATKETAIGGPGFNTPTVVKSYLDVQGGSIVYAYGGGNNATVTEKNVIRVNNPSKVVNSILDGSTELLTLARFKDMGINTGFSHPSSGEYQVGCFFGGNNEAEMAIRPTWHLYGGKIRSLYSGGNRGNMIYENGLFLEIPATSTLVVNDVYGGCRMADVRPMRWNESTGEYEDVDEVNNDIPGYSFPRNLAARLVIAGGDINNVYGGNDVRGKVYFGNAIGIRTSINGNVYGGGNGNYPYTDNPKLQNSETYGDLFYTHPGKSAAEGLLNVRPNAEQVSIKVRGTESKPTIVKGSIFVGGNCATLDIDERHRNLANYPLTELKVGSYAIVDNVYLGNNGEGMITTNEQEGSEGDVTKVEGILRTYTRTDIAGDGTKFNSMDLIQPDQMAVYMKGVSLSHVPRMITESREKGDDIDYIPYTSYIGSLFYGGNRGSMTYSGPINIAPSASVYIYNKLVAGCNNANIAAVDGFNARFEGGILGSDDEADYTDGEDNIRDRVVMNFSKLKLLPMRLNSGKTALEWNTVEGDGTPTNPASIDYAFTGTATTADKARRLVGGNIYGGCYTSGHVNGNVVINVNGTLHDRNDIFDTFTRKPSDTDYDDILYDYDNYSITKRNSGVILNGQGMDVEADALNVFGGGKGVDTEIWGSTTVNLQKGYCFQAFGGGDMGVIGKSREDSGETPQGGDYVFNGKHYSYSPKYSTTVNLNGLLEGESRYLNSNADMVDVEFIYGGGDSGPVAGDTHVNLDNGRLFNSWGGCCNSDVLGYADTRIGQYGFPYLRDHVYGGNDLGGEIKGVGYFDDCVSDEARSMVHAGDLDGDGIKDVLQANAYVEYQKGRMKNIHGGGYADYDYNGEYSAYTHPRLKKAFVNIRPVDKDQNRIDKVFGAGQGFPLYREGDEIQDRSYVLIDIADKKGSYTNTEVFGAGANDGLGMGVNPAETFDPATADKASAIIDLVRGEIKAAYGGSYNEGVTRRTVVNVPEGSTIKAENIFGGAYGKQAIYPCDVYESNVNYDSGDATVTGAVFGGNNHERRTLYAKVNITAPVISNQEKGYQGYVYGAGNGTDSWAEYTEVNLEDGAQVYEVYGGGYAGKVFNVESCEAFDAMDVYGMGVEGRKAAWSLGTTYDARTDNDLTNPLVTPATEFGGGRYNTNVRIKQGAVVGNYAYGGGYGSEATVAGTTYIALLGGEVNKDIYGSGTSGGVEDLLSTNAFTASTNVYIEGGTVRNVYGGGWRGGVGYHPGTPANPSTSTPADPNSTSYDILGVANVVIGKLDGDSHINGIPSITRNVYGGGEGGGVWGVANVTINNGYIGYRYKNTTVGEGPANYEYVPELDDKAPDDNLLDKAGNVFGGGYVANSFVDNTDVKMYGGIVRGSMYGGGEIGPIGRGTMKSGAPASTGSLVNDAGATIYKAGKTKVRVYDGLIKRDVFGGGRGYDNWNGEGWMTDEEKLTMDRSAKGYVFGQTEVNIYGGEIGTDEGLAKGYGNVFGGGDIGFVHSAYNLDGALHIGKKAGTRYDGLSSSEGYYYKHNGTTYVNDEGDALGVDAEKHLTEDCKVLIEPWCKAKEAITINGIPYAAGEYVPTASLNYLGNKSDANWTKLNKADPNKDGILIHNAVFAGGNTAPGSTVVFAGTTTVYGNATASIHDVYHRDLITVGTGHTGGLYGDGNLTLVDGYRELNITNYGTDYHHIQREITLEQYKSLPAREAAYYEIRYKCAKACKAYNGRSYTVESTISADELQSLFVVLKDGEYVSVTDEGTPILIWNSTKKLWEPNPNGGSPYWVENGVCSRYAGRIMNTIQRADFCGVFGSRMVMQGAQDRVPATVDYTNYTINRVREVSLNQKASVRTSDSRDEATNYSDYWRLTRHGNYFGIYNTVNFLGALTSDVDFGDETSGNKRHTENDDEDTYKCAAGDGGKAYGTATYYDWKKAFRNERKRNNGSSPNKVALASGVYLELTTEKGKGSNSGLYEKDWGYITGVVELDLISVQPGLGGGFVYAKNVHGKRTTTGLTHTILTTLNTNAVTLQKYSYNLNDAYKEEWQTSGNFVHSSQTIIDDCYNIGGKYKTEYKAPDGVPAHYWYIKGSIYIYDQYISAYTGSSNAYNEVVNIPLTITSASHGRMTLLEVQPNYHAYYSVNTGSVKTPLKAGEEIVLRDVTYKLNDPITYWDYFMLSDSEKKMFEPKTYVVKDSCYINSNFYPSGSVLLPDDYDALLALAEANPHVVEEGEAAIPAVQKATIDEEGKSVVEKDKEDRNVYLAFADVFRESNNLSHDTGYMLTCEVDNPGIWNTWYSKIDDNSDMNQSGGTGYEYGPTYSPKVSGLYGQQDYTVGNIISSEIYDMYKAINPSLIPAGQAKFERAYVVTADVLEAVNKNGTEQRFYKNTTLGKSDYVNTHDSENEATWTDDDSKWAAISGSVSPAYIVTSTIQLNETDFIYRGTYMTESQKTTYYNRYKDGTDAEKQIAADINKYIVEAYYCYADGKYGGDYYVAGHNYLGRATFSSLSEEDRKNFTFNYDALDLLIDPNYSWDPVSGSRRYGDGLTGGLFQYDGTTDREDDGDNIITEDDVDNPPHYSLKTPIDYTATFKATEGHTSVDYVDDNGDAQTATDGTVLTRTEFERLLNERYYYSPVSIKKTDGVYPAYYVVNTSMILGDTPYACGQVIDSDTYNGLTAGEKKRVTKLTFDNSLSEGVYYYCRESYEIAPAGAGGVGGGVDVAPVAGVTATIPNGEGYDDITVSGSYTNGEDVPVGLVISSSTYSSVTNDQASFIIHGLAPTETSTLYVTRNSDIKDLSTEKIITVVYEYNYVESDMSGMNIVPVNERHVLNIHINFRSGVPIVEDIQEPEIILPGTTVSIKEPYVEPGAYEVTGGGWELFDDDKDADSHVNGIAYSPNMDPLYLYQNHYLVAYYAQTYLGKTYSNAVPVTVANYHDLKKVMDATTHHYYIDHKDLFKDEIIEPKIYINDYSEDATGEKNGLDIFKSLYDLSVLSSPEVDSEGLINDGTFLGHKPLGSDVAAGNNLEFFLRTNIAHPSSWTPIGSSAGTCFEGTLHGDGHALTGLDHSLFNHLCGDVYNLGVTGSFTGAGVAETGSGYVENCWINTTGTPDGSVYAVFGNPSASSKPKQIVNCYYQTGKSYNTAAADHGVATPKPDRAFYNGEVTYDLNGFYLYKRYNDNANPGGTTTYQYWKQGEAEPVDGTYASNVDLCSSGYNGIKYVEDRFADGDFRYAAGTIPTTDDERYWIEIQGTGAQEKHIDRWSPIWPDDYLFFGQVLNYGYSDVVSHQEIPSAITRSDGRVVTDIRGNRVFRAPAYFRSKVMDVAHFNPNAIFAKAKKDDAAKIAYKGMTAIDFAGGNGDVAGGYDKGGTTKFYPPLLDDDGLSSLYNVDLTRNLLAYTTEPGTSAAGKTAGVVRDYLLEPLYEESDDNYRKVAYQSPNDVHGHWVENEVAPRSHFLVDLQDFNAPIGYTFASGMRMWNQRFPEDNEFVNRTQGWQGISLPFKAELVTTDDKGEITHFYSGSEASKNKTGTKIGHEYWLREFKGSLAQALDENSDPIANTYTATFDYPDASTTDGMKTVRNSFLWDYYYSGGHTYFDANYDEYHKTYYKLKKDGTVNKFTDYPLLDKATPYLLGLPGELYYEFDLSGNFQAGTTAEPHPDQLEKQYVTFASKPGISIGVSDDEMNGVSSTKVGDVIYVFKPSYMNEEIDGSEKEAYTLNANGDSYVRVADDATASVGAFRPYFTSYVESPVKGYRSETRAIRFSSNSIGSLRPGDDDEEPDDGNGRLIIYARGHDIITTSYLDEVTTVRIVTAGGATLSTYEIKPGQTVKTPVSAAGIYIVNKKKLAIGINGNNR